MQAIENPRQVLRKPRRPARLRKTDHMQSQPPKLPNAGEASPQQNGAEFTARGAGEWPPNTWWP
jgi:hypothetical protein